MISGEEKVISQWGLVALLEARKATVQRETRRIEPYLIFQSSEPWRSLLCSVSHQYREILYLYTIGFFKYCKVHVIFYVLVSHRNIIMYILQIYALRTSSPRIVLIYALHTSNPRIARPVHGLYHKPWIQGCA